MASPLLRIAELGDLEQTLFFDAFRFQTLQPLLDAETFDVVIVNASSERAATSVQALRRDPRYRLALIYCSEDRHPLCQALADGPPPASLPSLVLAWEQWRERLALFNRGRAPQGLDAQLLAHLWTRTPGKLLAVRHTGSPQHYAYPLLEAMDEAPVNAAIWIQNLTQRNLLDGTELVDRIRLCRQCGSGQLNYIDVCNECHSLDIHRQPSLHCFTCGHIGAQGQFLKDGALVCPNCLTRLRHIGTDYDRPLENYSCNHCDAFFVDADVEARCLDCGHHHNPDQLLVREIRHYQLSETGLLAARQGLEQQSTESYFGRLAMVSQSTFKTLLDWQIELIERHKAPSFAVLGMRFRNLGTTLERLGQQRGHALLDALIERIQEAIRDTDRCTRTSEEQLWLLLMHTDAHGLKLVTDRLNRISELFVGQDLEDIQLRTIGCMAPNGLIKDESAELLMARLGGEL